jgi:hypothetical protein
MPLSLPHACAIKRRGTGSPKHWHEREKEVLLLVFCFLSPNRKRKKERLLDSTLSLHANPFIRPAAAAAGNKIRDAIRGKC